MFDDKWIKYSYAAQKNRRFRLFKAFLFFLALFVLYNILTAFFVSIWTLDNDTMQPGLASGDRLVFLSFALPSFISSLDADAPSLPFKRGDIVLVDTALREPQSLLRKAADATVRFFTAQRMGISGKKEHLYLKRIIGLPGDEIAMTNFVLRVKPSGGAYSFTEFELADRPYYPDIPQRSALWDESLPFSGSIERIVLGPDECFVVSDDRGNTNDSRTWGPVSPDIVVSKAVFRFWPFSKIGRP